MYTILCSTICTQVYTLIMASDVVAAHRLDRHCVVVQGVPETLNAIVETTDLKCYIYTTAITIIEYKHIHTIRCCAQYCIV